MKQPQQSASRRLFSMTFLQLGVLLAVFPLVAVQSYAVSLTADDFGFTHKIANGSPSTFAASVPFVRTQRQDAAATTSVSATPRSATVRYDLGIGKNQPFVPPNKHSLQYHSSCTNHAQDIVTACQYLVEHQAVRDYPSPLLSPQASKQQLSNQQLALETQQSSSPKAATTTKKTFLRPRYHRRSEDVLLIVDSAFAAASASSNISNNNNNHLKAIGQIASAKARRQGNQSSIPTIVAHTREKLDLNTAWVEMLVHSEKAKLAARKSQ